VSELADLRGSSLTPWRRRFLRYWSLNITLALRSGQSVLPGFSYDGAETSRMAELAAGATRPVIFVWLGAVTLTYLLVAIAAVGAVIGTALATIWRNAARVSEPQIYAAIALMLVVMIGAAMPLSIAIGGAVADTLWRTRPAEASGDAALYAKVVRQFRRLGLVTGVLAVVAAIGWGVALGSR
jgi:hypothetical protein